MEEEVARGRALDEQLAAEAAKSATLKEKLDAATARAVETLQANKRESEELRKELGADAADALSALQSNLEAEADVLRQQLEAEKAQVVYITPDAGTMTEIYGNFHAMLEAKCLS